MSSGKYPIQTIRGFTKSDIWGGSHDVKYDNINDMTMRIFKNLWDITQTFDE